MRHKWWRQFRARLSAWWYGNRVVADFEWECDGTKCHEIHTADFRNGMLHVDRYLTPPAAIECIHFDFKGRP